MRERRLRAWANLSRGLLRIFMGQAADTVRETASIFEKVLRHTIETQTVYQRLRRTRNGWLLSRMHRPL